MDDGDAAIYIDMEETLGVDTVFPTACSNDTEEAVVVGEIEQKLNNVPLQSFDSIICRVPALMFNENPEAYIPHMVSIGPIHHDQNNLQPMEKHKILYFKKFLRRSSPCKLKEYVRLVANLVERVFSCYSGVKIERKSLIMMVLVDGGFILELLQTWMDRCSGDEVIWAQHAFLDLILVENQLPFFVLEELYRVSIGNSDGPTDTWTRLQGLIYQSLVTWVMRTLFGGDIYGTINVTNAFNRKPLKRRPKHLLAFVREFIIPSDDENWDLTMRMEQQLAEPLWCARDLKNASVKFEKNKNPTSLLDMNFDCANGVLTIPPIIVQDYTELILRNLMAYEIYSPDYSYITEYVMFLGNLINSGKDVELLQESEIFVAILAQPSDFGKLFPSLRKYAVAPNLCTDIVSRKLMKYSNRRRNKWKARWNKWKASLLLNYFNSPWSILSVVAAIILLVLTIIQAIFAVLSYH